MINNTWKFSGWNDWLELLVGCFWRPSNITIPTWCFTPFLVGTPVTLCKWTNPSLLNSLSWTNHKRESYSGYSSALMASSSHSLLHQQKQQRTTLTAEGSDLDDWVLEAEDLITARHSAGGRVEGWKGMVMRGHVNPESTLILPIWRVPFELE